MIDVRIDVEAPRADVLVNQRETARAYDQLARHEAMLQRALNRTLAEFRLLRDASGAAARSDATSPVLSTHPEPAPSGDGRPPALQGPRTSARSAHTGDEHDDGKALLQNEANSVQPLESTEESGEFGGLPRPCRETPPSPDATGTALCPAAGCLQRVLRRHSFGAAAPRPAAGEEKRWRRSSR